MKLPDAGAAEVWRSVIRACEHHNHPLTQAAEDPQVRPAQEGFVTPEDESVKAIGGPRKQDGCPDAANETVDAKSGEPESIPQRSRRCMAKSEQSRWARSRHPTICQDVR